MKRKTVTTTEKREVWVVRQPVDDAAEEPGPAERDEPHHPLARPADQKIEWDLPLDHQE